MKTASKKTIIPAIVLAVFLAMPAAASYVAAVPSLEERLAQQIERQLAESEARYAVRAEDSIVASVPTADQEDYHIQLPPASAFDVKPE